MGCEIKESLQICETLAIPLRVIQAVTIGSSAAKTLSGEGIIGNVYGVFDRMVSVLAKEEELFILARKDVQMSPITVLLHFPLNISMSTFGAKTGASVIKSGPFIQISQTKMLVRLDKATLWKARKRIKTSLALEGIVKNCNTARDVGRKYGKRESLLDLIEKLDVLVKGAPIDVKGFNLCSRHTISPLKMLVKAVLAKNLNDVCRSAKGLIGLGLGLTPSCDDMLAGFMSSLLVATEALGGNVDYAKEVSQVIASSTQGQTTLLSQKLLEGAALGEVPELIHNVVEAISIGTEEEVREVTHNLLAMGHFSGADTLLGILLGFYMTINMARICGSFANSAGNERWS